MKILFINTGPWGTGSFTAIKGLAKQLLIQGHEVKIFFPDSNLKTDDRLEYYQYPALYHIWRFPISNDATSLKTFPLMLTEPHPRNPCPILFNKLTESQMRLYIKSLQKELQHLIHSFNPDIIECHHIWYASWVLSQMELDYILTAHHSDQMGFRIDPNVQPYAIEGAQAAKIIFAISKSVKKEVMALYNIDESKIIISGNSYDETIFQKKIANKQEICDKHGLTIEPNATIINFAGKLSFNKGVDILLKANKLLDPALNIHFILMGAGEIDPLLAQLDDDSYSLDNIHFIGHQPPKNVAEIHNISKISLIPSRSEGFGVSCLEAMACGLPVVVTKSGGPENFAVGKIIKKNSPDKLAEAITYLLKLPAPAYYQLSRKALKAAKQFSASNIAQQHIQVYESILH